MTLCVALGPRIEASCRVFFREKKESGAAMLNAEEIRALLKGIEGDLPAPVSEWLVELGEDWTGDPAVWVWVVLADKDFRPETTSAIRDLVWETLRNALGLGVAREAPWPFIRFRSAEEMEQLRGKAAPR